MELSRQDALRLLGLDEGFGTLELKRARRRALSIHHPDHGGSAGDVLRVEKACELLSRATPAREKVDVPLVRRANDKPSFTIDVLPVDAFELLLVAASELGDVCDDDPPYRLEIRMHEPEDTWVVLELVPDAGGSTVSISLESASPVAIEDVRDSWIRALNTL